MKINPVMEKMKVVRPKMIRLDFFLTKLSLIIKILHQRFQRCNLLLCMIHLYGAQKLVREENGQEIFWPMWWNRSIRDQT